MECLSSRCDLLKECYPVLKLLNIEDALWNDPVPRVVRENLMFNKKYQDEDAYPKMRDVLEDASVHAIIAWPRPASCTQIQSQIPSAAQ